MQIEGPHRRCSLPQTAQSVSIREIQSDDRPAKALGLFPVVTPTLCKNNGRSQTRITHLLSNEEMDGPFGSPNLPIPQAVEDT
jgi:hypothetical protein